MELEMEAQGDRLENAQGLNLLPGCGAGLYRALGQRFPKVQLPHFFLRKLCCLVRQQAPPRCRDQGSTDAAISENICSPSHKIAVTKLCVRALSVCPYVSLAPRHDPAMTPLCPSLPVSVSLPQAQALPAKAFPQWTKQTVFHPSYLTSVIACG